MTGETDLTLGPLQVAFGSAPYSLENEPATGGGYQSGSADVAAVTGPGGIAVELGLIAWSGGSREVWALDCHGSPPRIQRLAHGGRIVIYPSAPGREWMQLRVSRMTTAEWSSEYQTTVGELALISRVRVEVFLQELGATAVGSRADVLGDVSRTRNELCVLFPAGNTCVPIAAYCIARVLPLLYGSGRANASLAG